MRVNFEWLRLEKLPEVEEWTEAQLGKLDRYLGRFDEEFRVGKVRVGKENEFTYKVSLEIGLPTGREFFVEEGEDLRSLIDALAEKAERWVRKHGEKLEDRRE